ncbi:HK97 gp10 family phage protein [Micromonospora provocatoris]
MEEIEGYHQLKQTLNQLEKLPQKIVSRSARSGAKVVLKEARKNANKDKGNMRKGIHIKAEKSRHVKKGKKVFQIRMNPKMNSIFQKPINDPGKYGGKRETGYYPSSQEHGFKTSNGKHVPGKFFLKNAFQSKGNEAQKVIIGTAINEVNRII